MPSRISSSVVLPTPLPPTSAMRRPARICRVRSRNSTRAPWALEIRDRLSTRGRVSPWYRPSGRSVTAVSVTSARSRRRRADDGTTIGRRALHAAADPAADRSSRRHPRGPGQLGRIDSRGSDARRRHDRVRRVRERSTGAPVVIHGPRLDRWSTGTGRVADQIDRAAGHPSPARPRRWRGRRPRPSPTLARGPRRRGGHSPSTATSRIPAIVDAVIDGARRAIDGRPGRAVGSHRPPGPHAPCAVTAIGSRCWSTSTALDVVVGRWRRLRTGWLLRRYRRVFGDGIVGLNVPHGWVDARLVARRPRPRAAPSGCSPSTIRIASTSSSRWASTRSPRTVPARSSSLGPGRPATETCDLTSARTDPAFGPLRPGERRRGAARTSTVRPDTMECPMGELVRLEDDTAAGVATIRLERPPMNAISRQVTAELGEITDELAGRDDIGAVVVWGGPKIFAAGADIKEFPEISGRDEAIAFSQGLNDALLALESLPADHDLGGQRLRSRRRLRAGHGHRLPHRRRAHHLRPARDPARHHSRCRRHPAPHAPRRHHQGQGDRVLGPSGPERRGTRHRPGVRDRRRRRRVQPLGRARRASTPPDPPRCASRSGR